MRFIMPLFDANGRKLQVNHTKPKTLNVELNLNDTNEAELWIKVRLLFVRGINAEGKKQTGKHDWAVFLTTDIHLAAEQIFQSVIAGALDEIKIRLGDMLTDVTETVDWHIQNFFVQTLQLDAKTLKLEANKSCS